MQFLRTCPRCNSRIEHKTKKIRDSSEKKNLPCRECTKKAQAGKKIEPISCPACRFPSKHSDALEKHSLSAHGLAIEDLYVKFVLGGRKPKCPAKCGNSLPFRGFKKGYPTIHRECYDEKLIKTKEELERINELRSIAHTGTIGWALNLTKETDERIARRADATTIGISKAKENGRWPEPWLKGKTKETDPRLSERGRKFSQKVATGEIIPWHRGKTAQEDERLAAKGLARKGKRAVPCFSIAEIKKRTNALKNIILIEESLKNYKNQLSPLRFECVHCKNINELNLAQSYGDRCRFCRPTTSKAQQEIFDFIKKSLNDECSVVMNDRTILKPNGLDIYVPSRHFALEFNGNYWHSELFHAATYHAEKTKICRGQAIDLLHIFEDEWKEKRRIVEGLICEGLQLHERVIQINECEIKQIGLNERKDFFNENSLEIFLDDDNGIGLFYANELIACVSLKKSIVDESIFEIKYCRKLRTHVEGAFAALSNDATKWIEKQNNANAVAVIDERFCVPIEFKNMQPTARIAPQFWWSDGIHRFESFLFTEQEALEKNLSKIWGCETSLYSFKS